MKNIYITSVLAITLVGCSPKLITISSKKPETITKKAELTPDQLKNWSHLDILKDSVPGMSIDKAYSKLLKNKKGQKVIVGVIDSGVDIEHKDLRASIWTNQNEIPENQTDDDKNNFTDDIHGWNFLGDIVHENLEFVRILRDLKPDTDLYKEAKEKYDLKYKEALENKKQVDFLVTVDQGLRNYLNKKNYTFEDVEAIKTNDYLISQYKAMMTNVLSKTSKEDFDAQIKEYSDYVYSQLNNHLNKDLNGRKTLGDDANDMTIKVYGNNNVIGPDKEEAKHGTHVSGIIVKTFGKNNNSNASNVQIMAIRAVPDGDEYDKDIALAIRYAVDNGASVINTSFGKEFSPKKEWVFEAIKYASKKDVLIVNAAGNDSYDIDDVLVYPNDSDSDKVEIASNFLTVGALNYKYGTQVVADFSNYGKVNVDVFAPGVKIYATTPNNEYEFLSGTSMAAPSVSGVAALIRSYYPDLSASEVKRILMESGVSITQKVAIGQPEEGLEVPFSETCVSGKMVNAYNALLVAKKWASKKK